MTRYQNLKQKPRNFHALTGHTREEFAALLPHFSNRFLEFVQTNTLDGNTRKKRAYTPYKNSPLPSIEDKLLFILIYLRKAMTQDVLGQLFGIQQPVANKWIHLLLLVLNWALADLGELPARGKQPWIRSQTPEPVYFHDGTERPINRPKDREAEKRYYSGKKNNIRSKIT